MIKTVFTISLLSISVFIGSCQSKKNQESTTKNSSELRPSSYAYFSSGCFWCVEAIFERVEGVTEAVSGYSGGTEKNPTYQNLGSHAETVMVLYDSNVVPVGEDQKQHLEVTRDLVGKINDQYGEGTLVMPKARIRDDVAKVPGLDGEKMSKSYNNTLPIFGDEKPTKKLIMRIKTDSAAVEDPKPTENSIILALYQLFADQAEYGQMISDYENGGCGYGDFKKRLAEAYWDYFAPMRTRREELVANPDEVDAVLKAGAEKARKEATKVIDRVRKAVGLA